MQLILSTNKPWNTNYCNEDGQVLYKAESPGMGLSGRIINISRVLPSLVDKDAEIIGDADLQDTYEYLAQIEYHVFSTSRIKYQHINQPANTFFRTSGYSFYGRNRIFNGPDGREYIWKLTSRVCKLFVNDPSNTPVALFHRRRLGVIHERRPASLEIFPEGEHMIDMILVTFMYVEKLRSDREEAATRSGNGG